MPLLPRRFSPVRQCPTVSRRRDPQCILHRTSQVSCGQLLHHARPGRGWDPHLPLAEDLEALLGNLPPFQGRKLFLMPLEHLRAFPPSLLVNGVPKETILSCPALRTERQVADFKAEGLGLVIMYDSAETVESIEQDMFFSPEQFTDGQHSLAVDFYKGTPEGMVVAQDVESVQDPAPEPELEPEPEPERTYSSLALDTRDVYLLDRDSLLFTTRTEFPLYRADSNTRPTPIGVMAHTLGCIQADEYVTAKGPERLMPSRMRNYQYSMADIDEDGMLAHFPEGHLEGSVRVQQQDCLVVVSKLSNKHHGECIACLNMANEYRVGGGYNTGARAQEEELINVFLGGRQLLFAGRVPLHIAQSGLLPGKRRDYKCLTPTPLRFPERVKRFWVDDGQIVWVTEGVTHYYEDENRTIVPIEAIAFNKCPLRFCDSTGQWFKVVGESDGVAELVECEVPIRREDIIPVDFDQSPQS
ncbi:hypothetical protein J8273_8600 [Carpediemonas membranifera]|uniref:Microbial-type PARG catalytic domain-containing protein n=1 Tax=Carpediemonas membranifera TaxID=201153 RepID=A0A8J6AWC7_9EUKA|nr:hypothetical protein J8273_8600 [Carpediemonas membranifera]|eukprot:KAG9389913.1 hypothetical protein J8273_8600 [Carpediemonas membranifera]